jgi:hypothetical protein
MPATTKSVTVAVGDIKISSKELTAAQSIIDDAQSSLESKFTDDGMVLQTMAVTPFDRNKTSALSIQIWMHTLPIL